ncbi:MAG: hypothetical protein DME21_10750, partial [Verrucomicrobia bacterium]
EHRHYIGQNGERMQTFCDALLGVFAKRQALIHAWCVLPNHYHALIETREILAVLADLGRMHGRLSFEWNGEELTRGRTGLVRRGGALHAERRAFLGDDELRPQ